MKKYYSLKRMMFEKIAAQSITFASRIPTSLFYFGPPRFLNFELTTICQWKCLGCPTQKDQIRPPYMAMDKIVSWLETLQHEDKSIPVYLFNLGEPLLHPQFFEILSQFTKHGFENLIIDTNLADEMDEEKATRLLNSGLSTINVAYDLDNSFRCLADFALVRKSLEILIKIRNQLRHDVQINLNVVVGKHNMSQSDEIKRHAKEMKVDNVHFKTLSLEERNDPQKISLSCSPHLKQSRSCAFSFWGLSVLSNGELSPCCLKTYDSISHSQYSSFKEAWKSRQMKTWRKNSFLNSLNCGECRSGQYKESLDEKDLKLLMEDLKEGI